MEIGSLVIAMRRQFDADMLQFYLTKSSVLKVDFVASSLPLVSNYFRMDSAFLLLCDANFPRLKAFAIGEQLRDEGRIKQLLFLDDQYHPSRAKLAKLAQAYYYTKSEGLDNTKAIIERLAVESQTDSSTDEEDFSLDAEKRFRIDCPVFSKLTNRELEVLTILAEGDTVAECAKKLRLAESTVDNHKSRLMKKLSINKSTGLVRIAIRNGLIEP